MKASFISMALAAAGLLGSSVSGQNMTNNTMTNTTAPSGACIDNLTQIFDNERENVTDLNETRTYILCTDTSFITGAVNPDGFASAQFPLVPRSNMIVLCGEDGTSDGNCTITGASGVLSAQDLQGSDAYFPDDDDFVTGFYVSGVTFANLTSSIIFNDGILGDLTFNDIIVRDNEAVRAVTLRSIFPGNDLSLWQSTVITFKSSQFLRNRNLAEPGEGVENFGDPAYNFLFYVPEPSTRLIVEDCNFDQNNFSVPIAVEAIIEENPGFPKTASLYYGASLLNWTENCFFDNYASRRALIDSRLPTPPESIDFTLMNVDNYVLPGGGNTDELRCVFVRQSFLIEQDGEQDIENLCINSTSNFCLADMTAPPSSSPAPSEGPTSSMMPSMTFAPVTEAPSVTPTITMTMAPSSAPSSSPSSSPVAAVETPQPTLSTDKPTQMPASAAKATLGPLVHMILVGGTCVVSGWMLLL
eukprot:CAMPEP_0194029770 /NCGR_PEP_ID=MMETSP0009_2-20130614/3425_1 /TAXON_ID=210454 /ORGANISM="Grammatophora oceanica, Strain CCMP 410" /LENGTH=471 /DNA_ID=CAMNT_0038669543 /DNA_START=21 /DNA_END=1436 /DNA_ORIENTATION=+